MRAEKLRERFRKLFSRDPGVVTSAPGRVNLIGEHTDYNDGLVMPAAINRHIVVAAGRRDDGWVELRSPEFGRARLLLGNAADSIKGGWARYTWAVGSLLRDEGHPIAGIDACVEGDIPIGSGLSSSAALEVASAMAFCELYGVSMSLADVARLCREAEFRAVGVRCGIMDQFASLASMRDHVLMLDCRSLEYERLPLPSAKMAVIVTHTGIARELSRGAYNERVEECRRAVRAVHEFIPTVESLRDVHPEWIDEISRRIDATLARRVRHVVEENARVTEAATALAKGDYGPFGRLMRDSHRSLRELYEVSCPELDLLVELGQECPGVYGSKMTGAGFGGAVVHLADAEGAAEAARRIARLYGENTSLKTLPVVCSASDGARVV